MSLLDRLRSKIEASGPMPFEDFMAACLYDREGGFFATGPLRSVATGDFLTSPEVSPWFGRTLGRFVADQVKSLGLQGPAVVADVGAGSGSLLRPLVEEVDADLDVYALDASPAARAALGAETGWRVGSGIEDLPEAFSGVVVANELLDNLPVALAVKTGRAWEERWVGADGEGLALVSRPARPEVASWADAHGGTVPEGGMVEVQLEACRWLDRALQEMARGVVVVVDYGGTAEELEPRRTRGTLRTYRAHHLGPDPLLEPGATDVTVDVNFTALVDVATRSGTEVEVHRQDDFLSLWGLREEVSRLRRLELDLARGDDSMERLRVRSDRTAAETLLHPRGLGDFRVLLARKV